MFSIEGDSDTYRNLCDLAQFVVNFVTPELAAPMELSACRMPPEEDEFQWAGVTPVPARRVAPFRVAEAAACLECQVIEIRDLGKRPNHLVLGQVVHYSVTAAVWSNGRVDPGRYSPLGRLSGRYVTAGEHFKLARPDWEHAQKQGPISAINLVRRST
jgi:flavin reductase (DIM6/NTAB) family NADH-FMN oxidoreductase RutF